MAVIEQPMIGLLRDGGAGNDMQPVVGESGFEEPSTREPFRFQNPYAEEVDEETRGRRVGGVDESEGARGGEEEGKEEEARVPKGLELDTRSNALKTPRKAGGSFVHSIFG